MSLLTYSILKKYDPSGMYKIYDRWPEIASSSYNSHKDQIDYRNVDHIIFAGMGGSGAIGDIFSSILSKTGTHVGVVKGYLLPKTVDSNTLIVTTSVSGDTAETLTILDSAKKLDAKIIAFSSGGKMLKYCKKNNIEHRKIEMVHSPRASLVTFFYSMLGVLGSIPITKHDINESLHQLQKLQKKISSLNLTKTNPSLELAYWISGIPLIYYPWGLQSAAIRFKSSLQENAKFHAMAEDVIEACHNGIVAWEKKDKVQPILVEGQDDYIKTKQRWSILKEYFEKNDIEYKEVFSSKGSILTKLINLIYLLDYATIYLATISKRDPSPIKSIDFIKTRL